MPAKPWTSSPKFNVHSDLLMWYDGICVPASSMFLQGEAHSWRLPATCWSSRHHWHRIKMKNWGEGGSPGLTDELAGQNERGDRLWFPQDPLELSYKWGWDIGRVGCDRRGDLRFRVSLQVVLVAGQDRPRTAALSSTWLIWNHAGFEQVRIKRDYGWVSLAWRAGIVHFIVTCLFPLSRDFYQREKWLPPTSKVRRDSCAYVKSVRTLNSELLHAVVMKTIPWTLWLDWDGSEKKNKKTLSYLCVK